MGIGGDGIVNIAAANASTLFERTLKAIHRE